MKNLRKLFLILLLCFVLQMSIFALPASAATGSASIGVSGALNPGKNITISITISAPSNIDFFGAFDAIVDYDTSYLKLVTTSEGVTNASGAVPISNTKGGIGTKQLTCTITFATLKVGSTTVKVRDIITDDFTVSSASRTLSITAPTKSSDNTLKSIKVGAGTLSPAFSKNVTEYKVTVPYSVDYFSIDGYATHSGAKVTYKDGPGPNIKVGTTVRVITVTAENGAVKKYNISVTRLPQDTTSSTSSTETSSTTSTVEPEDNKLETVVAGNKMTVGEIIPEDVTAPGFEKGEYTFNSVHVPAFLDKEKEVVLLYLLNEESKGELYVYNPATGIFSLPCIINDAKHYTILPVTALKRDQILIDTESVFNLSTITIGEQEVEAYIYKDDALCDFAVVCAINSEGEKGFYRYDKKENTLQRYVAEYRAEETDASAVGTLNTDAIVVLVCAGVCLAAIIAIIIIWAARRRYYADDFDDDFDDAEPLFVKETEFDTADEDEILAENENQADTQENEDETEAEEE